MSVNEGTICKYQTEFMLYVTETPLTKTHHNTITVHVGKLENLPIFNTTVNLELWIEGTTTRLKKSRYFAQRDAVIK